MFLEKHWRQEVEDLQSILSRYAEQHFIYNMTNFGAKSRAGYENKNAILIHLDCNIYAMLIVLADKLGF